MHQIPNLPCFIYKKNSSSIYSLWTLPKLPLKFFSSILFKPRDGWNHFFEMLNSFSQSFHNFALQHFWKSILASIQGIQRELWSRYCTVLKGCLCHFLLLPPPSLLVDAYPESTVKWQTQQHKQQQFGSLTYHLSFMAV